jgi:hypothetical protein
MNANDDSSNAIKMYVLKKCFGLVNYVVCLLCSNVNSMLKNLRGQCAPTQMNDTTFLK